MKKLRIYVDTSVIGGCFDVEFAAWSNALIEDFRSGRFRLVLSDVTAAEVARAPAQVRDLHAELLSLAENLPVTEESLALLENYQAHQVLDPRFRNMEEKNKIRAVAMVRHIRDEMAAALEGKSHAEIIKFFRAAGKLGRQKPIKTTARKGRRQLPSRGKIA
jgi:hypothetical protein